MSKVTIDIVAKDDASREFAQATRKMQKSVGDFQGTTEASLGRVGGLLDRVKSGWVAFAGAIGGGYAIQAGVRGVWNLYESVTATADEVAKFSERIGISTEALSALHFAGERSGIAINSLNMALQRMERRVGQAAEGGGEARDAIKQLGLNAQALAAMSPDETFLAIAEALSKVDNSYTRAARAQKIFDSEGVAVLQMVGRGEAGIRELMQAAEEYGVVVGSELAAKSVEARDAITNMQAATRGLKIELVDGVAPAVTEVVGRFTSLATFFNRHSRLIFTVAKILSLGTPGGQLLAAGLSAIPSPDEPALDLRQPGSTRRPPPPPRPDPGGGTDTGSTVDPARKQLDATVRTYEEMLRSQALTADRLESLWTGYSSKRLQQIQAEADALTKMGVSSELVAQKMTSDTDGLIRLMDRLRERTAAVTEQAVAVEAELAQESGKWVDVTEGAARSISYGLGGALTDIAFQAETAGQAFTAMAQSIISDIARIIAYKAIAEPIAGGILGIFGIGHEGGFVDWDGVRRMHHGGLAPGEVPIIAQRGEFMIQKPAVDFLGPAFLSRLNRAHEGGPVGPGPGGAASGAVPNVEINVVNKSGVPVDAQQEGPARFEMNRYIATVVLDRQERSRTFREGMYPRRR